MYTINLTKQEFSRLITTMEQSANDKRVAAQLERSHNSDATVELFEQAAAQCERIVRELVKAEHDADPLNCGSINQHHDFGYNDGQPVDDHCKWCGTYWADRFTKPCENTSPRTYEVTP